MTQKRHEQARALREQIQIFLRLFGLHQQHQTPCGQPLTVPHAHALMRLLDAAGGLRIGEVGAHLNIDKSNVSRLCARMEADGHIERRPCPNDGRAKRLWLTDEGQKLAAQVDQTSLQRFARLVETIASTGTSQIIEALEVLNDGLAHSLDEDKET